MNFSQIPFELKDPYQNDPLLQEILKNYLPEKYLKPVEEDLKRFSKRLTTDILAMSEDANTHPPELIKYDPWGNEMSEIKTSQGWKDLDVVSASEKIIAIGYQRKQEEFSRLYQFAKLYLFHPSSSYYTCPLAMTDGAAKLIETHGDQELKEKAFVHLTSDSPEIFWTSGQWMTEKSGGSDVSGSETIAKKINNEYHLYGLKWFTSATTSQMAMTLAKIEGQEEQGLSLFYLELKPNGKDLNHIEILRLKDKLGTKALPTAELKLNGTKAKLVGESGKGVKTISTLFNVTRLYNACTTMGAWKRLMDLSKDYAEKRMAFGKRLIEHPLHRKTLTDLEVEYAGCMHLTMFISLLLGRSEVLKDQESEKLLRLLTPVAKLFCAKQNMHATSELVESFGGAGYIENTGIPKWLRDNQTLCIWEGTTNVLSLDTLRPLFKEGAFAEFENFIKAHTGASKILTPFNLLKDFLEKAPSMDKNIIEFHARDLAFTIARISCAALLCSHAIKFSTPRNIALRDLYLRKELFCLKEDYSALKAL